MSVVLVVVNCVRTVSMAGHSYKPCSMSHKLKFDGPLSPNSELRPAPVTSYPNKIALIYKPGTTKKKPACKNNIAEKAGH